MRTKLLVALLFVTQTLFAADIIPQPRSIEEHNGTFTLARRATLSCDKELSDAARAAGLVGLGGAGFPTSVKLAAAKGGIASLTHALSVSFSGKVRVNSISPGWINNNYTVYEGADATQQPAGRVGNPPDIANMVLFLCSDKAGFITGENICIDGGQTRLMIYHGDHGWTLTP